MSQRHSITSANMLFLLVLLLQSLNFFLAGIPQYVRLILNEALFVLLPSLLYLRWAKLPFKRTVRLKSPGWRVALGSLFIGAGFYPVSVALGAIFQMVLKYPVDGAEALLPKTPLEGVLAIIAYAIMAPLCEEIFARGIIQQTYEKHFSPRKTILYSGVLFIVFHLSFLQGLTIIPLSLALGYVYWHTGSLVASILTHFGANAMAALVVSSPVFWQGAPQVLLSPLSMIGGLILVYTGFRLLKRDSVPEMVEENDLPRHGLRQTWPLVLAGLLYLVVIGYELGLVNVPQRVQGPVQVGIAQVEAMEVWNYEIRNKAGNVVAQVACRLESVEDTISWRWDSVHQAYDIQVAGGRYMGGDATIQKEAAWNKAEGTLLSGTTRAHYGHDQDETQWFFDGKGFVVEHQSSIRPDENLELLLETGDEVFVLESSSWPWVLRFMPFAPDYVGSAYLFKPYTWRPETEDNGPVMETVTVTVQGPETLGAPGASRQAWKVTVGQGETAWYSVDAPHVLLKYDSGIETMHLVQD